MRRDAVVIALVLSLAGCATIRADQMPPAWPATVYGATKAAVVNLARRSRPISSSAACE